MIHRTNIHMEWYEGVASDPSLQRFRVKAFCDGRNFERYGECQRRLASTYGDTGPESYFYLKLGAQIVQDIMLWVAAGRPTDTPKE